MGKYVDANECCWFFVDVYCFFVAFCGIFTSFYLFFPTFYLFFPTFLHFSPLFSTLFPSLFPQGSMLGETIFAVAVAFLGITLFANMATIFLIFRKVLSSSRHVRESRDSFLFSDMPCSCLTISSRTFSLSVRPHSCP